MDNGELSRLAQFLFEVGTMRKIIRMHRQLLLTDDLSDNIATHSFRVAIIGFVLAKMEGANAEKVALMCLLHDTAESRTNDHNWVHKRYTIEAEAEIRREQLAALPFPDFFELAEEYARRESREAVIAKDADILDQILLLREYAWQGNREALQWLEGKRTQQGYSYLKYLNTELGRALGKALYEEDPSSWWRDLYTRERRV